jgi:HTH-type transcriptional repressor of NAD biosynthesis genes
VTLIVSLLGGESTGKSTLARALAQHLSRHTSLRVTNVPEHLRQWCVAHGRAPLAHEQAALADAQTRLILAAEVEGPDVVIADTTALVIAAYSEQYFHDRSLWPSALDHQRRGHRLNLLMGLDLPWVADGLFRDGPAAREATDAHLRHALQTAGLSFQTIYGQGPARLHQALAAIGPQLGLALIDTDPNLTVGRVPWRCDNCSDPACEHRLFTALLPTARPPT